MSAEGRALHRALMMGGLFCGCKIEELQVMSSAYPCLSVERSLEAEICLLKLQKSI